MSLASTVSHTLMDKREAERNQMTLAGSAALHTGVFLVGLITKGSVRTLVRSVEESNGAEAWPSETQQIRSRHTESSVSFDAEDRDSSETLVKVLNQA